MSGGSFDAGDSFQAGQDAARCRQLANKWIEQWLEGKPPNAQQALAATPDLLKHKTILLDLAYEEYCLRTENGESIDIDDFCAQFSTVQVSLQRRLDVHRFVDSKYNSLRTHGWPSPGEQWLGYTILKELGRGAFGRVFLATEDEIGERLVAIKLTRFGANEADHLGRLDHPHIVPIHSVKQSGDLTVICMPFLGTSTLTDLLDIAAERRNPESAQTILDAAVLEDPLDDGPRQASLRPGQSYVDGLVFVATGIAEALQYSHEQGILHLDLKPSNILLSRSGSPMLLDFNLSHDSTVKEPDRLGGTLPYMSPEQLHNVFLDDRRPLDGRSDVFALGIVLSQLFLGRLPFGSPPEQASPQNAANALLARYAKGVEFAADETEEMIPGIRKLIRGCLAFDRKDRPSLADVLNVLRTQKHWTRRLHRWFVRYGTSSRIALAVSLAALSFLFTYRAIQPEREDHLLRLARAAYRSGELRRAITYLDDRVFEKSDRRNVVVLRSYAQAKLGLYIPAALDAERQGERDSDGVLLAIASEFFRLGGSPKASKRCAARAIQLKLDSPSLRLTYAASCFDDGEDLEGLAQLNSALQLDPKYLPALRERCLRCWMLFVSNEPAGYDGALRIAVPDAVKIVQLQPDDPSNYVLALLVLRRSQGRVKEAEALLDEVESILDGHAVEKEAVLTRVKEFERSGGNRRRPFPFPKSDLIDFDHPPTQ